MSLADELRQLQELHEQGALSDEEYAQAKARLLNAPAPPATPRPARPTPARSGPPAPSSTAKTNAYLPVIVIGLVVAACVVIFVFFRLGQSLVDKPKDGGLTLKVDRVETSEGRFLVHMTATNHTKDKLRLPLFGYFFVTDEFGNQYEADPFSSTFPEDVAPGATVSGYALMKKPLNPNATRLKVAFTTVFGSFAVESAEVTDVPVR
ncbi:MAG: SHOCT domain-containing protein [Planctomycetia bacterium]|nr:SHOCT domain-containing protein [Planctomycetia bacterium]